MRRLRPVLQRGLVVPGTFATAVALAAAQAPNQVLPKLSVPAVRIEAIGPTLVRLTADTPAGQRVYHIEVERRLEGSADPPIHPMSLSGDSYKGTHWIGVDTVTPSSIYYYRVRAYSGTVDLQNSDWSAETSVRTPPPPRIPPAAPEGLVAKALDGFQTELTWQDRSDNEYGFEILKTSETPPARVALVNPGTTRFVVHGRAPGSTAAFVVRAFNPRGLSRATPPAAVTQPNTFVGQPAAPGSSPTPGPCRTREQAMRDVEAQKQLDDSRLDRDLIQTLGGDMNLEIMPVPDSCGSANCDWQLYGKYGGCYRKLGELFVAGVELVGRTPAGAPLLLGVGHISASQAGYGLTMVENGRLMDLDGWTECDLEEDDATKLTPLFDVCQSGQDIRPPR